MGCTRRTVVKHGGMAVTAAMGSLAGCSGGGSNGGGKDNGGRVTDLHVGEHVYAAELGEGPPESGSRGAYLHAVDPGSGRIAWQFETIGGGTAGVVNDGALYTGEWGTNDGGWEGNVYAVDADTGEQFWATSVTGRPAVGPTVSEGRVYVGAQEYGLHVLDATSGETLWSKDVRGGARADPPTIRGDTIYMGGESAMYALDANSHEITWEKSTLFAPIEAQLIDGILYFGGQLSTEVWALDTRTRETIWTFASEYGGGIGAVKVLDGTAYAVFWNQPQTKSSVYALDPETGKERWRYQNDSQVTLEVPGLIDGVVYIADEAGTVHRIDAETGNERSSFTVDSKADINSTTGSMVVADGSVYLGNNAGEVFAYNARTGTHEWTTSLEQGGSEGILGL